jgi:hypothetical protein
VKMRSREKNLWQITKRVRSNVRKKEKPQN